MGCASRPALSVPLVYNKVKEHETKERKDAHLHRVHLLRLVLHLLDDLGDVEVGRVYPLHLLVLICDLDERVPLDPHPVLHLAIGVGLARRRAGDAGQELA